MQGYGTTEIHPLLVRIQNSTATLEQLCSFLKKQTQSQGIPWWSSGQDSELSQPGFNPWSGNEDPASCAAKKKKRKHSLNHMIQQYLPKLNKSKIKILYVHTDTCTHTKRWKKQRCPSVYKWINKLVHPYNRILLFHRDWGEMSSQVVKRHRGTLDEYC